MTSLITSLFFKLKNMREFRPVVLFGLVLFQGLYGSPALAQQGNWTTGLGPVLTETLLKSAIDHANVARQDEMRGEYGSALGEYQRVIDDASAAGQQRTGDLQEATAHYVLGLAELDHARMFRYLQVEHLFGSEYLTDLSRANQELGAALSLYQTHGVQTWPVYSSLAVVQTLLGDFASAQVSVQQVQSLNPGAPGMQTAIQQLATPPPQVAQAAAALRSHQPITPEQLVLIANVAEKVVGVAVLPRYRMAGSFIIGGIELVKAFLPVSTH